MGPTLPQSTHLAQAQGSPLLGHNRPTLKKIDIFGNICMNGLKIFVFLAIGLLAFVLLLVDRQPSVVVEIESPMGTVKGPWAPAGYRQGKMPALLAEAEKLQESIFKLQRKYGNYMSVHAYGRSLTAEESHVALIRPYKELANFTITALNQPHERACKPHEIGLVRASPKIRTKRQYCFGAAKISGERVCDSFENGYLEAKIFNAERPFGSIELYNKTFAFQPFFIRGSEWENSSDAGSDHQIAIVTQGSFNRLSHLVRLTQLWEGPVSFALLVDNRMQLEKVKSLVRKHDFLQKYLAVHAVWQVGETGSERASFYPINMMRNIAQQPVTFPWLFVLDVDVTPNAPMAVYVKWTEAAATEHDLNSDCPGLDAYVPPAVEMKAEQLSKLRGQSGLKNIISKNLVVDAFLQGTSRPMHLYFGPAYGPTNHFGWVFSDNVDYLPYLSRFEPYYIARNPVPLFNESFVNRGGNYAEQVLEMHMAGYRFYRLPHAFVIDIPHQTGEREDLQKASDADANENLTNQLQHQEDFVAEKWESLLQWLPHRYGFNSPSPFDMAFRRYRRQQQEKMEKLWDLVPQIGMSLKWG